MKNQETNLTERNDIDIESANTKPKSIHKLKTALTSEKAKTVYKHAIDVVATAVVLGLGAYGLFKLGERTAYQSLHNDTDSTDDIDSADDTNCLPSEECPWTADDCDSEDSDVDSNTDVIGA